MSRKVGAIQTALKDQSVPLQYAAAIFGHTNSAISYDRYGGDVSLEKLNSCMGLSSAKELRRAQCTAQIIVHSPIFPYYLIIQFIDCSLEKKLSNG